MRTILFIFAFSLFYVSVYAACTGNPPTYNGLPCATTTRYWDTQKGACGCGSGDSSPFSWNGASYTAAASQLVFDHGGSSWCGAGCGTCFEITPTGDCPTGGPCASNTNPIVIMVTNLCPNNGNTQWCPNPGSTNQYGYAQHFDLRDPNMAGWVDNLGWNNPVVTYKQVECGTLGSPSCSQAATCQCSMSPCYDSSGAGTATSAKSSTSTSAKSSTSTTAHSSTSTTAKSTTSGSGGSGSCHAAVSTSFTVYSSNSGGGAITVTNTGSSPITQLVLAFSAAPTSEYNLVSQGGNHFSLASYAYPLASGSSFTGAGFAYSGSQPSITINSVSC